MGQMVDRKKAASPDATRVCICVCNLIGQSLDDYVLFTTNQAAT
jgi:hypothetical protein